MRRGHPWHGRALIDIVIPHYNNWTGVQPLLDSIYPQREWYQRCLIIDDGSSPAPSGQLLARLLQQRIELFRQSHQGVSAARNRGVAETTGDVILFVDADCRLHKTALEALHRALKLYPDDVAFQLHICGELSALCGVAEDISQRAVQQIKTREDGYIRWLNTSGFAIRRDYARRFDELFDKAAQRSQDTLLLATMMLQGVVPRYVVDSVVFHLPSTTTIDYILKAWRSAQKSAATHSRIRAMGAVPFADTAQKLAMLRSVVAHSRHYQWGTVALMVVLLRRLLQLAGRASVWLMSPLCL